MPLLRLISCFGISARIYTHFPLFYIHLGARCATNFAGQSATGRMANEVEMPRARPEVMQIEINPLRLNCSHVVINAASHREWRRQHLCPTITSAMPPARTRRGRASNLQSDAEVLETLPSTVASVFSQVQHSVAVHRKHQVALCAVHQRCAEIIGRRSDGSPRLVGEKLFIEGFLASLNRVLGIKRGESVAERCIKFAASYTAYAHDAFRPTDVGDDYDETPAERFSEKLLKHLLRGFGAKDKNVRLRCVELVALLVVNLGAIDDEMFVLLKALLKERIFDKEAPVRMQAVIALAALQGPAEEAGEDAEAIEIRKALIWLLRHDPSAYVDICLTDPIAID